MKNSTKALILTLSLISCVPVFAAPKIISGTTPAPGHPGEFNTIALVKDDGKIFCTGSLVGQNLIATAKHCLVDKELGGFKVYFGHDTTDPVEELYREVESFKVRYPKGWSMMFPSFDVAWVQFQGNTPDGFRPLPVLSSPEKLAIGQTIHQVGYGNSSPERGKIEAGVKLHGLTQLHSYINNPRFFHVLVFKGEEGQGSCHGDSGGPAYTKIDGQWYIIGVTNGFDIVLTPGSMLRTGDPDFPYDIDCTKNESLYSFLGAHGNWIEQTSGVHVEKEAPFQKFDRTDPRRPQDLFQWCQSTDFGSSSWNLLKVLLDQKVDQMDQDLASNFYNNCQKVTEYLSQIEEVHLDFKKTMEAELSFENIGLLPRLKKLGLSNFPKGVLNLRSLSGLVLEQLHLQGLELQNLDVFSTNSVQKLSLRNNPLQSLEGIEKFKNLESLNISNTQVNDLRPLQHLALENLEAAGLNSDELVGLDQLPQTLKALDLRSSPVESLHGLVNVSSSLKRLLLTGGEKKVDLSLAQKLQFLLLKDFTKGNIILPESLKNLTELSITNSELESLGFLATANRLEKATLTFNNIKNLDVFLSASFPYLKKLNLSVNPIENLSPLKDLESLNLLRVFRTPIRDELTKTEENCPTRSASTELSEFCSK